MVQIYADSFVYALGERRIDVRESAAAGRLLSTADDLESAGFRWHWLCEPETSGYDLAQRATDQLAGSGKLERIDGIVYATCLPCNGNLGSDQQWQRTRDVKHLMEFPSSRLQADFGLDQAITIGLNQQACTGMLGSMRVAAAMLSAEPDWDRVLCVTADRFPENARYEQAYNLVSDGAAACIVRRHAGAFRIIGAHQISNGGLAMATDDESVGTFFSYMHRLIGETLTRLRLTIDNIDWLVPQNANEKAWQILARVLGVNFGKVWFPSLAEVGHVTSADNAINLALLVSSGHVQPGEKVALVVAGAGQNFQCIILEAMETTKS